MLHYFPVAMLVSHRGTPTWRPILGSVNLPWTFRRISQLWDNAQAWNLENCLLYSSCIISQFLDFIHWMVFDFNSYCVTVRTLYMFTSSITKLLNLSIRTGKFPKLWKCSKITALFKSGDRTTASNYRPISILPTLSEILEKAVHSQLYQYLVTNNLLTRKQFGFRKGLSTVSALIICRWNVTEYGTR